VRASSPGAGRLPVKSAIASTVPTTSSTDYASTVRARLTEAGISPSAADVATLAAGYEILIEWRSLVAEIAQADDEPVLRVAALPAD
jgi:hypothetical protein